jgi:hypothetical protein
MARAYVQTTTGSVRARLKTGAMPSVWTRKQKGYSALDQRVVSSEEGIVRAGRLLNATMERNRIVCVFDGDYSAHGSVVYSAVRLLIDQLGDDVSYDVFCQDVYRGPKFKGAARVTEGQESAPCQGQSNTSHAGCVTWRYRCA